jgi:hypothetical protein
MKVLKGHTSPATAFLTMDYPFGRSIRCVQRYWVETAEKGAKKGEQRLVSQTTHKMFNISYTARIEGEGQEAADAWARAQIEAAASTVQWNAPKGATYNDIVVMGLEPLADGSGREGVQSDALNAYSTAEDFTRFRAAYYNDLSDWQRAKFDLIEKYSRRMSPNHWAEYDAKHVTPGTPQAAAVLDAAEAAGVDTGMGGPLSDLRDSL